MQRWIANCHIAMEVNISSYVRRFYRKKVRNGYASRANNPCHPNPTALVGNSLTDGGNVVEVVKVR